MKFLPRSGRKKGNTGNMKQKGVKPPFCFAIHQGQRLPGPSGACRLAVVSLCRCVFSQASIDFFLRLLPGVAIPFLQLSDQLVFIAGHRVEIVISELAPPLLYLPAYLFPLSLNDILIHCSLHMIWLPVIKDPPVWAASAWASEQTFRQIGETRGGETLPRGKPSLPNYPGRAAVNLTPKPLIPSADGRRTWHPDRVKCDKQRQSSSRISPD